MLVISVRCIIGWNKIEGFICLCGGVYLRGVFSFFKIVYNIGLICYFFMNFVNNININLVLIYGWWFCLLYEYKVFWVFWFISDREIYLNY